MLHSIGRRINLNLIVVALIDDEIEVAVKRVLDADGDVPRLFVTVVELTWDMYSWGKDSPKSKHATA